MKKFEYYSFFATGHDNADQALEELGADGWEAYAVEWPWFYLKREKLNE